ncbi:MAG: protein-glutamate O-methyltransferase CheR [Calditrichia bacterium]|nr:protein-glutamate O-methyltransferase CheR [Calditrichia bacterium]
MNKPKFATPFGKKPTKPSFLGGTKKKELSEVDFKEIREFIYSKCGIYFADNKKYLLENRLNSRLDDLKQKTFAEYIKFLKFNPAGRNELNKLFDAITINETSFFRNLPQINAFADSVTPEIFNRIKGNPLASFKIWSAASSSGEEPYTLAMILYEKFRHHLDKVKVEIIGTDISEEIVQKSREAIYSDYSMRNIDAAYLKKYFEHNGNKYHLKNEIKQMVKFGHINLLDKFKMSGYKGFDVIFCRNVLIYFDSKAKTQVVNSLYDSLKPGGYLFIGHSESLHGISRAFKLVHFVKAMGYKKE